MLNDPKGKKSKKECAPGKFSQKKKKKEPFFPGLQFRQPINNSQYKPIINILYSKEAELKSATRFIAGNSF